MNTAQIATALRSMGWRTRSTAEMRQSVRDFQRGYAYGSRGLAVDGIAGPLTQAALTYAVRQGGRLAPHFRAVEFACKCGGRYSSCRRVWISRTQVLKMEAYRAKVGPVSIVSACRCVSHNRAVGGVSGSQHLVGTACDISGVLSLTSMRNLHLFGGLGYKGSTGRVIHADSRAGSTSSPTTWRYAT